MDDVPAKPSIAEFAEEAGISVGYACEILNGRDVPVRRAIDIFRRTGRQFGPIKDASRAEIEMLSKFHAAEQAA